MTNNGKPGMFGVYVAGSGVHGYFDNEEDARAYQQKMWASGCYYVPVFRYGDGLTARPDIEVE